MTILHGLTPAATQMVERLTALQRRFEALGEVSLAALSRTKIECLHRGHYAFIFDRFVADMEATATGKERDAEAAEILRRVG